VLSSALFDLTLEAPSLSLNAAADPKFDLAGLARRVRRYAAGAAPTNPLLSPLYGNLHGLPPLQLLVAGNDPLLDDSLAFASRRPAPASPWTCGCGRSGPVRTRPRSPRWPASSGLTPAPSRAGPTAPRA
jgi:hypothetical protein